jgi:predicted kinase
LARKLFAPIYCAKSYSILNPPGRRYEDFGRGIYSDDISRLTYDKAYDLAAQKIKQGKAVIIDASFKRRTERQKALDLAKISAFVFISWNASVPMKSPENVWKKECMNNDNASDGRWELFHKQKDDFDAIDEVPADCHFKIDTSVNPEITRQGNYQKN